MSLIDLKRKKKKVHRDEVKVDEFIDDAVNYATGKPSLLEDNTRAPKKGLDKSSTKIFRHATFTLTEASIDQLNQLSANTNIAKSRLLRILIQDFTEKTEQEQAAILDSNR